MNNEQAALEEILNAREQRAEKQRKLINTYKTTLISFTLNIPGANKNSEIFAKIHDVGISLLEEKLYKENISVLKKIVNTTAAGREAFLSVEADALSIKRITASIEEEHKLGRLFDFDVFDCSGSLISRTEIGFGERKCLLCGENAKVCGRSRRHSLDDLLSRVYELINEYK